MDGCHPFDLLLLKCPPRLGVSAYLNVFNFVNPGIGSGYARSDPMVPHLNVFKYVLQGRMTG